MESSSRREVYLDLDPLCRVHPEPFLTELFVTAPILQGQYCCHCRRPQEGGKFRRTDRDLMLALHPVFVSVFTNPFTKASINRLPLLQHRARALPQVIGHVRLDEKLQVSH
jgi:hypothetical protein